MDSAVMKTIELSCRERGVRWKRMGSGAGHDSMTFPARGIPAGMIFVPSKEGKSHCPEELIRWEDAAMGAQILADTAAQDRLRCEAGGKRCRNDKFLGPNWLLDTKEAVRLLPASRPSSPERSWNPGHAHPP